jgi:Penicillin-insensitive murein endopeptidase
MPAATKKRGTSAARKKRGMSAAKKKRAMSAANRKRGPNDTTCMAPDEEPRIEATALTAAAAVPINTQLNVPTTGLYGYGRATGRFGIAKTIEALKEIGSAWAGRHADIRIGIGDISQNGGGKFPPHKAHKRGIEADIRPLRKDHEEEPTTFRSSDYSRALTQELVDVITANSVLTVNKIFFNDPNVRGVQRLDGHDNHLHVRFEP